MARPPKSNGEYVTRFSVSLPPDLVDRLDRFVEDQKMPSRSQALAEMIENALLTHSSEQDDRVMAGTVTVVYTNNRIDLRQKLARIQKVFLKEVISSQHVFLEEDHSLEVLLVQGPNRRLQMLRDEIMSCKGVTTAKLTLTGELLPPLH